MSVLRIHPPAFLKAKSTVGPGLVNSPPKPAVPQPLGRGVGLSSGPKPAVPQPLGRGTGLPPGPFPRVVMKTKYKTEEAEILNSLFNFPSYQENRIRVRFKVRLDVGGQA